MVIYATLVFLFAVYIRLLFFQKIFRPIRLIRVYTFIRSDYFPKKPFKNCYFILIPIRLLECFQLYTFMIFLECVALYVN